MNSYDILVLEKENLIGQVKRRNYTIIVWLKEVPKRRRGNKVCDESRIVEGIICRRISSEGKRKDKDSLGLSETLVSLIVKVNNRLHRT